MNGGQDTQGCDRFVEALLPTRPAETEQELLRHAAACPACGDLLARRTALAAELAALPRLVAPTDRGAALDFPALDFRAIDFRDIVAQLDGERFESEIARGDATTRALLQGVLHHRAPATLTFERITSTLRSTPGSLLPLPLRSPLRLTLLRRVAACAAVALVGLSLWPLLQGAPPPTGFAAETAALSDRPSLAVRIVELDVAQLEGPLDAGGAERVRPLPAAPHLPGRASLPARGGP